MSKYARGKIYKLVNDIDDEIHIGSTYGTLRQRKAGHKRAMIKYPDKYKHFTKIGFENVSIILIESYPCCSKDELHAREQYWVDKFSI